MYVYYVQLMCNSEADFMVLYITKYLLGLWCTDSRLLLSL